jgi:aspartate aminotransferase-like enzyme
MSYKLFIPGPIAVSEKTLQAMAQPMIGHRSTDFVALYQSIQPDLQALLATKDPVYLSTSSAWGVMEGSLRNVVQKKVLNCMNGAFSDKWYDVALRATARPPPPSSSTGASPSIPPPCAASSPPAPTTPSPSSTTRPPAAA